MRRHAQPASGAAIVKGNGRSRRSLGGRDDFDIRIRRRHEVEQIAKHVGAADTDDFGTFLMTWMQVKPETFKDPIWTVQNVARRMRGKVSEEQAAEIIEEARSTSRPRSPDAYARRLGGHVQAAARAGTHHYRVGRCQQKGTEAAAAGTGASEGPPEKGSAAPRQGDAPAIEILIPQEALAAQGDRVGQPGIGPGKPKKTGACK